MHKRLYLVLAVLVTPIILLSCAEHGAGNKVDPKVLAATVDKASTLADTLDKLNARAYGMGQVGAAMAVVNPAGAGQVLDDALLVAKDVHSPVNKAALQDLQAATKSWGGSDLEQVKPALVRIENATTRVWAIRSIAESMALINKSKAMSVMSEAAAEADAIADKRYKDLDLRGVASAMAALDAGAAADVAGRISDLRDKAWALTVIGAEAAKTNRDSADKILTAAAEAAAGIKDMSPSSTLINDATKEETKALVLKAEKARLVASSAKATSKVAVAMNAVNPEKAQALFGEAVKVAGSIELPYTRAYAVSDVAMDVAEVNPAAASELAWKIEADHEDAQFAALLKAAKMKSKTAGVEADLVKAEGVAAAIKDSYDKAKALAAVAKEMIVVSREKAADIAGEIDYPELKNEILADIAVALSKESDDKAKEALGKIAETRFANKGVLYVKANALADMAEGKAGTDADAAKKLYGKAAGAAAETKSAPLQWKIASGLCKLDHDKLFEMAAKIESDNYNNAMGLADIAADWSSKGDSGAGMVWDMAAKAAGAMDDDYASSETLNKVASRCAQYDKARATAMLAKSLEKVKNIGKPKEG